MCRFNGPQTRCSHIYRYAFGLMQTPTLLFQKNYVVYDASEIHFHLRLWPYLGPSCQPQRTTINSSVISDDCFSAK